MCVLLRTQIVPQLRFQRELYYGCLQFAAVCSALNWTMRQPQAPRDAYYSWNYCVKAGDSDYGSAWRLYTSEELYDNPSRQDGISLQAEQRQKSLMVTLIHSVGAELMQ